MRIIVAVIASVVLCTATPAIAEWPRAQSPAIPDADGYVNIPGAAVAPDKAQTYRAIFDATQAAERPTQLVPALNMVGSELNALAACGVPLIKARFALVFHGGAMVGILDEAHYKAKFGVSNPNLKVLAQLKRDGVEMFVCGQNLASDKIDPKGLAPEVRIASDALIVLMTYQSKGYALLSF
jgi:intracellular sulfur oxidation DsrE/DsrF family protein